MIPVKRRAPEEEEEEGDFDVIGKPPVKRHLSRTAAAPLGVDGIEEVDLFAGLGREAFLQKHVHKKLHARAAGLSDDDLAALGRLEFNRQFPELEAMGAPAVDAAEDLFLGMDRETFTAKHVHKMLHAMVRDLDDEDLHRIGRLSFKDQFVALQVEGPQAAAAARAGGLPQERAGPVGAPVGSPAWQVLPQGKGLRPAIVVDVFGGIGREAYMQQRVHRKLHTQAAGLGDQELLDLGRLTFNDQFPVLEQRAARLQAEGMVFGAGVSREIYMQQRVHRKLHAQVAGLSNEELLELGRLTFNDQFPALQQRVAAGQVARDVFSPGMTREAFMRTRVHRKLHVQAAALSDEELLQLGKLTFNDQFPVIEQRAGELQALVGAGEIFPQGVTREGYMQQRVHRKLHGLAMGLPDEELLELGKLSFNDQFPALEQRRGELEAAGAANSEEGVFGAGVSREAFMKVRVHRRLHARAAQLSDQELLQLGSMSFNQQFPFLEEEVASTGPVGITMNIAPSPPWRKPTPPSAASGTGPMGTETREAYLQRRVHRRLHAQTAALGDEDLHALGQLSFNDQFPALERLLADAEGGAPLAPAMVRPTTARPTSARQPVVVAPPGACRGVAQGAFAGSSREEFMAKHVHRRLHAQAADMSDEELLSLGKLTFKEQFPIFNGQ